MRALVLLVLFFYSNTCIADFYFVSDSDGYVNLRKKPSVTSSVLTKIPNDELIYCVGDEQGLDNGFCFVEFNNHRGYIHFSRLNSIRSLAKKQNNKVTLKDNKALLSYQYGDVQIIKQKFNPSNYHIEYTSSNANGFKDIVSINGKKPLGTEGHLPKYFYKSISGTHLNKKYSYSSDDLDSLYEPYFEDLYVFYKESNQRVYFGSINSDGAGSYDVLFEVNRFGEVKKYIQIPF